MTTIRLFAAMREIAGSNLAESKGNTVAEVLDDLSQQFGDQFALMLPYCMVLNGDERVEPSDTIKPDSALAVLPPVSGG
jgi:molybdopterin converting factor small subunit